MDQVIALIGGLIAFAQSCAEAMQAFSPITGPSAVVWLSVRVTGRTDRKN